MQSLNRLLDRSRRLYEQGVDENRIRHLDTGGLLGPHIQPFLSRLSGLIGAADDSAVEVRKRIRVETLGAREFHLDNVHLKLPLVGEK